MGRFYSVLFDQNEAPADVDDLHEPEFFADLNLGQVVEAVVAGREEYRLRPFFYAPLHDTEAVGYRHEVLRDLERGTVRGPVDEFARKMRRMREYLAQANKLRYRYQKERWFLDAVDIYCGAVTALHDHLAGAEVTSRGIAGLLEHLAGYVDSGAFRSLVADTRAVRDGLAKVKYCVRIRGPRVTVSSSVGEADYSNDVEKVFDRFKQGAVKDHLVALRDYADMNHVEAQVLDRVAMLYPGVFRGLDNYCERHADYLEPTIGRFDREVQFYLAYLAYMGRISASGLPFCYPEVSDRSRDVCADGAFDLALATRLVPQETRVVCNSFRLAGRERVVVVTGPNQGGKTTFARMFGQLPYLAGLGLPVPAARAQLFLPDRLFTHFEREEDLATLRGKLDDELIRIRDILDGATANSIIVMNESFDSTTLDDARYIGTEVLTRIVRLGALTVYVTFVDELASMDEAVVSMVGDIVPDDPAQRTYTITRRAADGLAYAAALAEKYGLTHRSLRKRITS